MRGWVTRKWCINDVYLGYITFQYWDWFWLWRSGWVLPLVTVWEKMIVCCHFIWILNLGGISYHKTASLAGAHVPYTGPHLWGLPRWETHAGWHFHSCSCPSGAFRVFFYFPAFSSLCPSFLFVFLAFVLFLWGPFCLTLISFDFLSLIFISWNSFIS